MLGGTFGLMKAASAGGTVYATWNPADKNANVTLSAGNLTATSSSGSFSNVRATVGKATGKWYFEVKADSVASPNWGVIGVGTSSAALGQYLGVDAFGWGYDSRAYKYNAGLFPVWGATWATNDVIGVAVDMDAKTITMYKNGVSQGVMYANLTDTVYPMVSVTNSSRLTANFGATAFAYSPPAGHNAGFYS